MDDTHPWCVPTLQIQLESDRFLMWGIRLQVHAELFEIHR